MYYRKSSRELKRLNAISRSPILNLFSETFNGITTIRSLQIQKPLISENMKKLDMHSKVFLIGVALLAFYLLLNLSLLVSY
jgi:hypothetical protein